MKTKDDRKLQAIIQIDACRQRISFLKTRIEEEEKYLIYLREKYARDLDEKKDGE